MKQRTIKNVVKISGIGLHSGKLCTLKLTPSAVNTGIVFFLNMKTYKMFEYKAENVCNTMLATSIGSSDCFVSTVEHLMACIHVFHITNIGISIEGPELPILDGSAYNFYNLLLAADIEDQEEDAKILELKDFSYIKNDSHFISCTKGNELSIRYDWYNPMKNKIDVAWYSPLHSGFSDELEFTTIYKAKTFCSYDDIEKLRSMGLIKGGTENNAVVYNKEGVMNKEALQYNHQYKMTSDFAYHKLIDFIGDIAQLSTNIHGHFHVMNSGHALNNEFCKAYLASILE